MPSADFCAAVRMPCDTLSPEGHSTDLSKLDDFPRAPAGFTVPVLDGYGLCDILPARPTDTASYPVSVRRVAILLHAYFRQSPAVAGVPREQKPARFHHPIDAFDVDRRAAFFAATPPDQRVHPS